MNDDVWKRVLARMNEIPERQRRLVRTYAWSPVHACGCILGTLYPNTPKDQTINLDLADHYGDEQNPAWLRGFYEWVNELGLTTEDLDALQDINDAMPQLSQGALWARVHRYVSLRAQGVHGRDAYHRAF